MFVPCAPSLISLVISVDVKRHVYLCTLYECTRMPGELSQVNEVFVVVSCCLFVLNNCVKQM